MMPAPFAPSPAPASTLPVARLVSARWIFPITRPPIADGAVALDAADTVVDVGPRAELVGRFATAPEDRAEGVVVPGLVNAHTHLELSALAGQVAGGQGLVAWAGTVVQTRAGVDRAAVRAAATRAAAAAVRQGTAAVGDVANSLDAVGGIAAAGLRGMVFHELLGSREARTGDALADAARELEALTAETGAWPAGLAYAPAPHALYSAGADLLRRIFATAARTGLPTSIHVAEDPDEIALLRDGSGRWPAVLTAMGVAPASRVPGSNPVAYLDALGAFAAPAPPLLVHMVHTGDEDRRLARDVGATAVLCPRSNLHIGGVLADVPALLGEGVALALGTDSLASAEDLSLWAEMATLHAHFPSLPAMVWLSAATRGGAEALRLPACGAIAAGKRPGLLDVLLEDYQQPLESLVRDPQPCLRWMARA
ncbi:MAG TPA: amidohydrolase family protein [Polyangia bacterium]|jgi:cytosine/adenosine deaminase-related metal-dependent hydrolase